MTQRIRLPNRREHNVFTFTHGIEYSCGYARFPDGGIAELFLNAAKANSDLDIAARDASVAASIALQYGATVETIYKSAMRNPDGTASGALGRALEIIIKGE